MRAALRAEWAKLRTGAAGLVVPLLLAGLLVAGGAALGDRSVDPVQVRLLGVRAGQAAVAAAGVYAMAGEFRTGLIRVTLLAVPCRLRVLTAKAVLLVAAVTPVAVAGVVVAVAGVPVSAEVLRAAGLSVLYLVLIGLLGLGVAAMVRDSAVAAGIVLGLLYLMPMLLRMLPDPDWQRALYRLTPATAVQALAATGDTAALPLGPWAARIAWRS